MSAISNIGLLFLFVRQIEIEATLTGDSLQAIPLEERCIAARVVDSTPPPEPGFAMGSLTQCLGDDPPVLIDQGSVQAFTPYPCVDASGTAITSYPCDASGSTSEVAVIAVADTDEWNPDLRSQGVGRSILDTYGTAVTEAKLTLLPDQGNVTIQIKDPSARVVSGDTVTWQTGRKARTGVKAVPGVIVGFTDKYFLDRTRGKQCPGTRTCRWWSLARTIQVRGVNPGSTPPGGVKIKNASSEFQLYDANSGNSYTSTRPAYIVGAYARDWVYSYVLEFSTLGTHVIDYTAGITRRSDRALQEATGTYTFHVGPVAELEVRAVWDAPGIFTITARNNGPDDAPAARVRVSLPQGMRFIRAEASDGSYDPNSGVWNIGRLAIHNFRRAGDMPESATLTVYTEPTGDAVIKPVTATIANHQDYCVRIKNGSARDTLECDGIAVPDGYTEHSTHYYDYIPGNNEARLTASFTAPVGDSVTRVTGMSVTSSPDAAKGYYLPGQDLEVEATFSDRVTAAASAKLLLQVGQSLREATAVPSTGEAIRFRYRVQWADRTDPGKGIRVTADPFVGPSAAIQASGGKTLSLLFPGKDLGSGHAIGPQPDRVPDTNVPMWSLPVFLTTGQEGARYRFIDGMRHYYAYDSLTRRWEYEFRLADADPGLSDDDLDLVQWLTLRASGYYGTHNPHPYEEDAHPVAGRPYLGRWDGGWHYRAQTCWGLEAEFSPGKTREQRLRELGRVLVQRISWGRVDWEISGGQRVSSMLDYAHSITPETCPEIPEERLNPPGQVSLPPGGAAITGLKMNSMGPYKAGDAIEVAVIFDRDVKVTGGPQLAIEVGGGPRTAKYSAGPSKPRSMVFRYTVLNDDRDSDGVSVYPGSIVLPAGASIRDDQRTDALLGHEGLAAQQGHTVGPVKSEQIRGEPGVFAPPAIVTGLAMHSGGPYAEGDVVSIAATFDWDVAVEGTPELSIEVGGSPRAALYQPSLSDDAVKVFSYTVLKEDSDTDGVSVYPGSIALPAGASIRDDQGTDADLTIAGLPPQPGHTVDGSQEGQSAQQQTASNSEPQTVPADWSLIPEGIGPGDSFRLLFVTSSTTTATSTDIADYNAFVHAAVTNTDLASFSDKFRALISTASVNIRDNSKTTGTGVPVHWLGGDKVADDYADLYDLSWDSVSGMTETGSSYTGLVWTGSNGRGETSLRSHAGAAEVRMGNLGEDRPLSSPTTKPATEAYPLYALSPVITVAAVAQQQQQAASNSEPQFASESDTRSVAENAATGSNVGAPVTATDDDGDALTYALSGSNAFAIGARSGQITAQGALDYETQSSYALTVTVSDGKNASGEADATVDDSIAVTVSVGNVDEAGTVSLDAATPQAGSLLTASLSDPDGGVSGTTWTWERSADSNNWTAIAGATAQAYTPSADDVGSYLRATASYADGHGSGKSAATSTTGTVEAAPAPTPTPQPEPEPPAVTAGPVITSSPASGDTYDKGEAIVVAMTFSESVTVAGEPRIRLRIGERNRWARYARSEANGTRLVFSYTVKGSDRDENGVSIEADQLWLNHGSITDADGNAARLEHPALAAQSGHKVDGSPEEQPVQQQPATSTVAADSDQTGPTVAADSPIVPDGMGPGNSFRLLFVTSATTTATSTDVADYNGFVQALASANAELASFSDQFTAYVSTATADARVNTGTTGTGVSVHWLGGEKVADDYADLYDGDWDSVSGMTDAGDSYTGLVWTGGNKAGEKSGQKYAGAAEVRLGDLSDVTLPLSSPTARASSEGYPLYALSPVITVAQPE